jgi:hypothetical protein
LIRDSEVDENPYMSVAVTLTTTCVTVGGIDVSEVTHTPFPESRRVAVSVAVDGVACGLV